MFEDANQKEANIKQVITKANKNAKELIKTDVVGMTMTHVVRNVDFYINVAVSWLNNYDDVAYLGCYANKLGDVLIALYHQDTIYLIGEAYKTVMYAPKIIFHMVDANHIHIDDVLMKHNSVGNGSVAMTALLLYAQNKNVKIITGMLSTVDNDHSERRNKYYEKYGFDIKPGKIIKYL